MGGLRAYGPQVLHGNGPDPSRGLGPVCHSQRLVQVVPYLLSGRPQHRTPHQTPLPVVPGERHQPVVRLRPPGHILMHERRQSHADTDTCTVYTQQLYVKCNTGRYTHTHTHTQTLACICARRHRSNTRSHARTHTHTHTHTMPCPLP